MEAKVIARIGVMAALVAVTTMAVSIPVPGIHGFINFGDTLIILTGLFFGPMAGLLAGGIGSALADMLLGYPHWAVWTLVIKGGEGLVVGKLRRIPIFASVSGAALMVVGYFAAAGFMYGWAPAAAAIPGDSIQGGVSVIAALLLFEVLKKRIHPIGSAE